VARRLLPSGGMLPDNEPLRGLQEREVTMVNAAVKDSVKACREALTVWLGSSETQPVERAISQAAASMIRSMAASEARPPGPAATLLVRLLLIALIEEMGRPHVVTLN
jgi:hypothetical protein